MSHSGKNGEGKMKHRANIQRLIDKHESRLQILNEKKAVFGLHTAPEILVEIEEIEEQIRRLRRERNENGLDREFQGDSDDIPGYHVSMRNVRLFMQSDNSSLCICRQQAVVEVLAVLMRIPSQKIRVERVFDGIVVFDLLFPSDVIEHLRSLLQSNSGQLRYLYPKITKIMLESESGEMEDWALRNEKFQLL